MQEDALKQTSVDIWQFTRKMTLDKGTKTEKDDFAKIMNLNIMRKNLESDDMIHIDGIPQRNMLYDEDLLTEILPKSHLDELLAIQMAKQEEVI